MSLIQTQIFLCFEFYTDSKKCKNEPYKQVKQEGSDTSPYVASEYSLLKQNSNTEDRLLPLNDFSLFHRYPTKKMGHLKSDEKFLSHRL